MTNRGKWPGTWAVICDVCGVRYPSDQVKKRWDGLIVCEHDWEPRHIADLIKVHGEKAVPSFTRPEQEDQFVDYCTLEGRSGYVGLAVVDCSVVGNNTFPASFLIELSTNGHE